MLCERELLTLFFVLFFLENVKRCPCIVLLAIFEEHETEVNLTD